MSGFGADELAWPAQGPDLNLIEIFFGIQRLQARPHPTSLSALTNVFLKKKHSHKLTKTLWKAKRVEAFIAVIVVKAYSTLSIRNRLSASSYACESRRANTFGNMCISPIMNLGH